ncbi:hypothetical protein GRF29_96g242343 [Pseudopithomyces chartarum]|uniref:Uncharacterized protein n=1 Tax=Pseudopithomyces chartarum TaxID=1892770 RepID=A0AAN6RHV1_9PLEO|nr:hypothetical protein GRF29_96g242343 [Pseudopithomyces chartarum]
MLLTLAKPQKSEFEFKTHDYSPTAISSAFARYSPKLNGRPPPSHPQPASASTSMGTPHRGLPPPSAMTLPEPARGPSISQPMGSLPPAPTQWQGAEDGMKNWLAAKAEEEKRRQEEERTRQEDLRVQQRQIEQSMLRESLQGGVPPHLIPMIFAGMGGGSIANVSAEMLREHQLDLQAAQRQAQAQAQLSPDLRRETKFISQAQPGAYGGQPQTPQTALPPTAVLPGQPLPSQSQHAAFSQSPYAAGSSSPRMRAVQPGAPTSAPRPPPQSQLPRLTTNEMQIQQPPTAPSNVQQLQQAQSAQQEQQSSPSIYFHHWVPPNSQQEKTTSGNPPATPSGKYRASPAPLSRQRATSHASDPDYTSSPKKRKAQGGHAPPPPPTTAPQTYTSPSFSHVSTSSTSTPGRRGHTRARSDASGRGPEGRGSALSRRGTISTHGQAEAGAHYNEPTEYRFQPPLRGPEEHHQREASYAPSSLRSEGGGGGQHPQSASSMSYPAETRHPGPHQQHERVFAPSPKREPGGQ